MGSVAVNDEVLLSVRWSKHRGRSQLVFEYLETFLTLVCPFELDTLMQQISQRPGNLGEVLDESTAIAGETEKTSDLLDILRRSPIENSLNSLWVDSNTILRDDMPKVGHFRKPEFTFRILCIELMFSKLFQNKSKVFSMFFFVLGVYKDIIQINHDELVEVIHEYIVHQTREGGGSIR